MSENRDGRHTKAKLVGGMRLNGREGREALAQN
jgi:hypothetical protein